MKIPFRALALEALVGGYVLIFFKRIVAEPFAFARLLPLFVAGAVIALFVQGPQYGTIDPISTRPLMVVLGITLMGASLVLSFAVRSAI